VTGQSNKCEQITNLLNCSDSRGEKTSQPADNWADDFTK